VVRGKLKEGARAWMTCMVSVNPAVSICRAVKMSTGTAFSASTPTAREPTVISSAKVRLKAKFWTIVAPASGRKVHVRGTSPADVTFTSYV
jgi:hypothetical protein